MFGSSLRVLHLRQCWRAGLSGFWLALIIISSAAVARAQIGGVDTDSGDPGNAGKNTIQGILYYSDGRRLDRRVRLKLHSIYFEQFTMSDDSGAFSFRQLKGGRYNVLVEPSADLEPASETVDIIEPAVQKNSGGQVYNISLKLHPRIKPVVTARTVDASTFEAPEEAQKLYKQALEASKSGDRSKAIELLNAALKIHPRYMSALNELGVQYVRLKEWSKAEAPLNAAIQLAPSAFAPRLNHGIVLLHKRDYKNAYADFQRAAGIDGASATARLYLGETLVGLGAYKEAEQELLQAVELGGSDSIEAHRYLGAVYIETGEPERAARELETYLKLAPATKDSDKIREIIKKQRSSFATSKGPS